MPDPKIEAMAFPRGRAGLLAPGPVAPGPGEIPVGLRDTSEDDAREATENLGRLSQALTPQLAAEVAAKTARAEARGAAREVLEEERKAAAEDAARRRDRLRPFFGFMESLRNLSAAGPGGEGPEGRTELVLKLYRLVENGGPKPGRVFQTQVVLSQDEALNLADPDFEGRTMEWALQQGQFGKFEWRLLGWADGEGVLDTSYTVTVEAPAGYQPPARAAVPVEPEPKPDPMGQLRETLAIVATMREAFGMKGGGGGLDAAQVEVIKAAAASQARLEATEAHRRELRDLEDRHRRELEEAERRGLTRGREEGKRELEAERLRWELSRAKENPEGPSFLQEVAGMLGGPDAVQGLVGGLVSALNRPAGPRPAVGPRRMPPQPQRMPQGPRPVSPQAAAPLPPAAPNPGAPEPTRNEWRDAMNQVGQALEYLDQLLTDSAADPETLDKAETLRRGLEHYRAQGEAPGSLAVWWASWPQVKTYVDQVLSDEEEDEGGETMDLEGLRALLIRRLDEGATDARVLEDLAREVPEETRAQWRGMLRFVPAGVAAGMIGQGAHTERLTALLEAFKAGD